MFRSSSVIGSWTGLAGRLEATEVLARWGTAEPELTGLTTLDQLHGWVAPDAEHERADRVLGALVRVAAIDGGNDPDAVLVLLHLLSDGALALASRWRDLADDILFLVVGQLTVQIRTFPWRRRTRAYAANLLLDTKAALWRELRGGRLRRGYHSPEVLVDPLDERQVTQLLDAAVPGPGEEPPGLNEVLVWAARTGVAPHDDLALLAALASRDQAPGHEPGCPPTCTTQHGPTQTHLAHRLAISERTLRRRRDRALAALSAASGAYLRAVA